MEPYAPINGPDAWLVSDFPDPSAWTVQLSEQQIRELEAAVHDTMASGLIRQNGNYLEGVSEEPSRCTSAHSRGCAER